VGVDYLDITVRLIRFDKWELSWNSCDGKAKDWVTDGLKLL